MEDTSLGKGLDAVLTAVMPLGPAMYVLSGGTYTAADAMKGVGGQLKKIGKYWWDAGKGALSWLTTSKKEEAARKKAAVAALKRAKEEAVIQRSLAETHRSALAMERAMGMVERAANSSAVGLAKLGEEVAGAALDNLGKFGGSAGDFAVAVRDGADSVVEGYRQHMRGLARARKAILDDSAMQPQMRAAALAKLHKAEMAAAAAFMEGMMKMTGQFKNIPAVAQAELQIGLRNAMQGLSSDAGSDMFGTAAKAAADNLDSSFRAVTATAEQMGPDLARAQEAVLKAQKSAPDQAEEINSALRDAAIALGDSDLAKKVQGSVKDGKVEKGQESVVTAAMQDAQQQMEEITSKFGDLTAVGLSVETSSLAKEAKEAADAAAEASNSYLEINYALSEAADGSAEQVELQNKEFQALEARSAAFEKSADAARKVLDKSNELADFAAQGNKTAEEEFAALRKKFAKKGQELQLANALADAAKKYVGPIDKEMAEAQKKLFALKSVRDSAEKALSVQKAQTDLLGLTKKSVEGAVEQMKSVTTSMDALVDQIDNAPYIKGLKRESELLKERADLAALNGEGADAIVASIAKENEIASAQIKAAKTGLAKIAELSKAGGGMVKALEAMNANLGSAQTMAGTMLEGLGKTKVKKTVGGKEVEEEVDISTAVEGTIAGIQDASSRFAKAVADGNKEQQAAIAAEITAKKAAFDEQIAAANAAASASGKTIDTTGMVSVVDEVLMGVNVTAGKSQATVDQMNTALAKATATMQRNGRALSDYISKLGEDSELQVTAKAMQDAASAQADLAITMGDASMAADAYQQAVGAIATSTDDMLRLIADSVEKSKAGLANAEKEFGKDSQQYAIAELQYKQQIALAASKEAGVKDNAIKNTIAASQKQLDADKRRIGIQQEALSDQISFLEEIGGSYETIFALKAQEVANQAKILDMAKEHLARVEASGVKGAELDEARKNVQIEQNNLQKKAMGAQKDAYEKMIGFAFGSIRSARGARKLLDNQARFVGRGKAMAPGDIAVKGEVKTTEAAQLAIAQKVAETGAKSTGQEVASRELSVKVLDDARQGKDINFGEVAKGTQEGLQSVQTGVEKAAATTEKAASEATEKSKEGMGVVEDKFDSLLDIQSSALQTLKDLIGSITDGQKLATIDPAASQVQSQAQSVAKDLTTGVDFAPPALAEAKSSKMMESMSGIGSAISGMLDGINMAMAAPQGVDVAVGGRVNIEFNNPLFKSTVVDIIANELGKTGSLTSAMDQRYPAKGTV
jgi:hypothetical protein